MRSDSKFKLESSSISMPHKLMPKYKVKMTLILIKEIILIEKKGLKKIYIWKTEISETIFSKKKE
jgi:hypothetical protein